MQAELAFRPRLRHQFTMHRRLVFEEPISRAALWSRRLILFAIAVMLLALAIFRFGEPTLQRLTPVAGAYVIVLMALAMAVLAFIRIWQAGHRGAGMAAQAFALALIMLAPAAYAGFRLATLPALTDISTDIDDPPGFGRSSAALAARKGRVSPDLAREERRVQRQAYPKVVPIVLEVPAEIAFDIARKAAVALGWQVLESSRPGGRSGAGRIEAVAHNRFFGLYDDITIRVRPRADGSRIDIRSASRIGWHDLGTGAARIAAFTDEVDLLNNER